MIKKTENCIYCGEKMESITAKKKYCSAKCRLYFNREKKNHFIEPRTAPKTEDIVKDVKIPVKVKEVLKSSKKHDFSNVEWFFIKDFTEYPIENRPLDYHKGKEWDKLKEESDSEIRKEWFEFKKKNN